MQRPGDFPLRLLLSNIVTEARSRDKLPDLGYDKGVSCLSCRNLIDILLLENRTRKVAAFRRPHPL